jgi:putative iron-dependent peroxidase
VLVTASDDRVADSSAVDGSYVVVQKYVHELGRWNSLGTETQESIIGRTKFDNIELEDCADEEQKPHKQLATITDGRGKEHGILRDNMPFGSPAEGEYGTYFIGYSRYLWVTEKMIQRMFVGDPPGKHDRILDFSKALTGCVFFAPSAEVLDGLGED